MDDPDEPDLELLKAPARQFAVEVGLAASVAVAAGCGTFAPPVDFRTEPRSEKSNSTSAAPLRLEPVEGRPGGLVLQLAANFETRPGSRVEVWRRHGENDPTRLRAIGLGAERAAAFSTDGIRFIDRSVEPDTTYDYRVAYFRSTDDPSELERADRTSEITSLSWGSPPPRPKKVAARADFPDAVELRWSPHDYGALIFRRDVLQESESSERLASVPSDRGSATIDRDVRAGRVYAYRVSLSVERDGYTQYGPPSESLYVSVPEEGEVGRQKGEVRSQK